MPTEPPKSAPESQATPKRPNRLGGLWRSLLHSREASILIAGILLVIYFQSSTPVFLSWSNIANLVVFAATIAIIAAGEVMVIICGEFDLSVGMVYALAPFVMFYAHEAGVPYVLAIVLGMGAGAVVGLVNGLVTVKLQIPSFITTLGTLFIINGFTLTISGGFPVQPQPDPFIFAVFGGNFAGFPVSQLLWAVVITALFQFILVKTRWGLHTVATGGNLLGASEVGIKTARIKIGNFMICSALGAFAGILDCFRISSADPLAGGTDYMFRATASAVIGGTLLTGGSGTVIGAFLGAVVLGILSDGFTLLGYNAYTFNMILGAAILITMVINVRFSKLRAAGGGK